MVRYREHGELGLLDRPSVPHHQPTATPAETVARIETLRRNQKWSAACIAHELTADGISISVHTVSRHLAYLGLNRRRFLDPNGRRTSPAFCHRIIRVPPSTGKTCPVMKRAPVPERNANTGTKSFSTSPSLPPSGTAVAM